jgi:hypothetical protein
MRGRILAVGAVLALVAAAQAEVHLFWTAGSDGFGLTKHGQINPVSGERYEFTPSAADTSDDDVPDFTNNLDYADGHYDVGAFPVYQDAVQWLHPWFDNMAYLWMQFDYEVDGAKLESAVLDYVIDGDITRSPTEVTYYRQDNLGGPPDSVGFPIDKKRWDGDTTMPHYPEFEQDPQSLVAASEHGVQNRALIFNMFNTDQWNMWDAHNRVALLGAVRVDKGYDWTITIPLDGNGDPMFVVSGEPVMPVIHPFVRAMPEPGSVLLLGAVTLLGLRRP